MPFPNWREVLLPMETIESQNKITGDSANALGMKFPYRIYCQGKPCPVEARYKVASRWSDGFTWEWKTYGLYCETCVLKGFTCGLAHQKVCAFARGENLDKPMILELSPGQPSSQMVRRVDLEQLAELGQTTPGEARS